MAIQSNELAAIDCETNDDITPRRYSPTELSMTDIVDLSNAMGTFYPRSQRILDHLMRANDLSITGIGAQSTSRSRPRARPCCKQRTRFVVGI